MLRRFRPKIRVYGNRRHGCSFKATINCLIWNDVELVVLQNCDVRFSKFLKFPKFSKFSTFFFFFKILPLKITIFKKTVSFLEGNSWWICAHNFKSISSKIAEIWHKTCQKQAPFTSFRDFTVIFRALFFDRFWRFKSVLGSCFAFFAKIWPKNMYRSSKSHFFIWPFSPGDLRWPWPLLWSQSTVNDTYKCQRHYPCRLVGFVCA